MASVTLLFQPERWLTAWRAIGGTVYLADPALAAALQSEGLLEMGPTFPLAEPGDSPRRRECLRLQAQIEQPAARAMVADYLRRQAATQGQFGQTNGV